MNILPHPVQTSIKRLVIYLTILIPIAAAMIVTINLRHATNSSNQAAQSGDEVDSFMHGLKAKTFNQAGQIADTVTSHYASHDAAGNIVLQHPYIVATEDNAPAWHIRAKYGKLNGPDQKIIDLWDHVSIIQGSGINSQAVTLLTLALRYDSNKEYATTDQPVTIIQPDSVIHGVGMVADIKRGDIKLLHNTHAQYVVHNK